MISIVLFREKPATPPTRAHATVPGVLTEEIKVCLRDKNLIYLVITFGIVLGIMTTYGTIIGIICAEYGYTDDQASLFGAVFIVGGIIGSGVFGGIVEVKKNYKVVTCVICVLTATTPVPLLFSMKAINVTATAFCCSIVGFASISILPVGIDYGVELTYPISESVSSALLMSSGQVFGIVFTIIASLLISRKDNAGIIIGQVMMICAATCAAVLSFFI